MKRVALRLLLNLLLFALVVSAFGVVSLPIAAVLSAIFSWAFGPTWMISGSVVLFLFYLATEEFI